MKRLFTVVMAVVIVLFLAVLGVVGFLTTKYVAVCGALVRTMSA
jgi:hypothetical protein